MVKLPSQEPETQHWAGHGHVGAFLLQLTCLVAVLLAVWGFFLVWALRYAGQGVACSLGC